MVETPQTWYSGSMKTFTAFVLMFTLGCTVLLFAQENVVSDIRLLSLGTEIKDSIHLGGSPEDSSTHDVEARNYNSYRFTVTQEILSVSVALKDAPADLDLFVKKGTEIVSYQDVDFIRDTDTFSETINLSRFGKNQLSNGEYFVDVAYQRDEPVLSSTGLIHDIPYTLSLNVVKAEPPTRLLPGQAVNSSLSPATAMARSFSVDVPQGTETLGIAVFGSQSDLDLFVSRDPLYAIHENSQYRAESFSGKEQIHIETNSPFPLQAGRYTVTVADQMQEEEEVSFSIVAYLSKDPPPFLRSDTVISIPQSEFGEALAATVQVIGENVKGSGCLVSETGYVLTAYHVVRNNAGKPSDRIVIAATTAHELPPEELYTAFVVSYDERLDLALLKIEGEVFGFPLPSGNIFPFLSFGRTEKLSIGQPLFCIGYPTAGSYGPRASVSVTRGIVSGFERRNGTVYIKSDALIDEGNSGGALINVFGELVGLPVFTAKSGKGRMSFFLPVSAIPDSWFDIFSQH